MADQRTETRAVFRFVQLPYLRIEGPEVDVSKLLHVVFQEMVHHRLGEIDAVVHGHGAGCVQQDVELLLASVGTIVVGVGIHGVVSRCPGIGDPQLLFRQAVPEHLFGKQPLVIIDARQMLRRADQAGLEFLFIGHEHLEFMMFLRHRPPSFRRLQLQHRTKELSQRTILILQNARDFEHRRKILGQFFVNMLEEPEVLHDVEKMFVRGWQGNLRFLIDD